jgi:hypothetical protein
MRANVMIVLVACGLQSALAQSSKPREPSELTTLRRNWQRERKAALAPIDQTYIAALEAAKARLTESGDLAGAGLIAAELQKVMPGTASLTIPNQTNAAATRQTPAALSQSKRISAEQKKKIEELLQDKVWRVDDQGEGLRWYYFAKDNKCARRSRFTNGVWSAVTGTWKVTDYGTVEVTGIGNSAQVFLSPDGTPTITLNHQGTLTVRPLHATQLAYSGEGQK